MRATFNSVQNFLPSDRVDMSALGPLADMLENIIQPVYGQTTALLTT